MSVSPARVAGGRTGSGRPARPHRARMGLMFLAAACTALPQGLAAQEEASADEAASPIVATPGTAPAAVEPPAPEERLPNPLLTFSLSQGLLVERNPDLAPDGSGTETRFLTALGFSFLTETPISLFEVSATGGLSLGLAGTDERLGLDGPTLGLRYERAVPSASVAVSANVRRDDIEAISGLDGLVSGDGTVELPVDFEDLEGEGVRRAGTLETLLTLRDDRPFGIALSATAEVVDYADVTSEDLVDFLRLDAAARFRFDLNEVAQVRVGLRSSVLDEDGEPRETRLGLDLEGSLARPDGSLSARLSVDEAEDGFLSTLALGRSLERPLGTFSAEIGLTRDADGDLLLTGRGDLTREFRNGTLVASFDQSVGTDDGEEELASILSVAWTQEISPLTGLSIDALFSDTRGLDSDERDRDLEIGFTLNRRITRDWSLAVGYRHRLSDEGGEDRATGDSLFLGLSRSFQGRF